MVAKFGLRLTRYLLFLIVLIFLLNAAGLYLLKENGLTTRFVRVDANAFDQLGRERPLRSFKNVAWFKQELAAAGFTEKGDSEQVVSLLHWVMDQVKGAAVTRYPESSREALEMARQGESLSCGPMSDIFTSTLNALGYRTRRVQLVRSLFNQDDTHVTTEVLINGRWVVYDPTFNVSYERQGKLLGVQDIRVSLKDGTASEITPVFYGDVTYPARLESYYIDWLPLYNNAIIYDVHNYGAFSKYPPMRYWDGPRTYYVSSTSEGLWTVELGKQLYFLFVAVLPIVLIVLVILLIPVWVISRKGMALALPGKQARFDDVLDRPINSNISMIAHSSK